MQQMFLVKVTDFKNGAYPIKDYRNGIPYSENAFLVSQAIGSQLQVTQHCKQYYKTIDTNVRDAYGRLIKHIFFICKKDCIVLQEIN